MSFDLHELKILYGRAAHDQQDIIRDAIEEIERLRAALKWIDSRDPGLTRKTDYTDKHPRHFYEVAYDVVMCARAALNK